MYQTKTKGTCKSVSTEISDNCSQNFLQYGCNLGEVAGSVGWRGSTCPTFFWYFPQLDSQMMEMGTVWAQIEGIFQIHIPSFHSNHPSGSWRTPHSEVALQMCTLFTSFINHCQQKFGIAKVANYSPKLLALLWEHTRPFFYYTYSVWSWQH